MRTSMSPSLGIDPKQADQQVRARWRCLPGRGRSVRVLVFAKGEKAKRPRRRADFVGAEEFVEKIQGGWTDFDVAIATPT